MTLPTTMRAVQYTEYGASNVLTINQVPVPTPARAKCWCVFRRSA
ncbi:hypothetical protein RA11412_2426 [Rothia aeria]|uniref:Uncharacterized protein n=1 Tax=Rothia aeria TaxID=172042 RepID=A0A2Z5R1V6_9MICC|nr:hypothetical protein RA11412_2426 [Rothia aeria]